MEREEDDAADDARERFTRALEETRRHLRRQLYKLQEQLERTFVKGEVSIDSQDDPAELTARIGELLPRLEDATEPDLTITNDVAAVEDTIRSAVARRAAKIWEAIKEYLPRVDARDRALIEEAHRASDVATLHEHLDCLGNGQPLRSPDADETTSLPRRRQGNQRRCGTCPRYAGAGRQTAARHSRPPFLDSHSGGSGTFRQTARMLVRHGAAAVPGHGTPRPFL